MRVWVHCDCAYTPKFNHTGFVVATDTTGSLVRDLLTMADAAHASGIGVVLSLFNGALMSNQVKGLVEEDSKMESCAYSCIRASTASRPDGSARTDISTVLIPMVSAFRGHPGVVGCVSSLVFSQQFYCWSSHGDDGVPESRS